MKIDEKTVMPIGWALAGFGVMISVTVVGSFWVAAVNFRLQRIEEKLGIPAYRAENVIPSVGVEAFAAGKDTPHVDDAKRLLESIRLLPSNR